MIKVKKNICDVLTAIFDSLKKLIVKKIAGLAREDMLVLQSSAR